MSNDWKENHTSLCKYIHTISYCDPADECTCEEDNSYMGMNFYSGCDCPTDPLMNVILLDVRIVGDPIVTDTKIPIYRINPINKKILNGRI